MANAGVANEPNKILASKIRMRVWGLGICLAILSVLAAIVLRNISLIESQSYRQYIPSLYFVALNTAIIALAEGFGLAFLTRRDGIEKEVMRLLAAFMLLLVFILIVFVLYTKSVINLGTASAAPDWWDVAVPFSNIAIAASIVGFMKSALNKITV